MFKIKNWELCVFTLLTVFIIRKREWFEYKENWFQPIALGEYISALSNSAALVGKKYGYFIWE